MGFQYQEALDLAKVAKDAGAETVFGGYYPTPAHQEIGESQDAKRIDYIVRGEGEATFRDLVRARLDGRGLEDELGLSCNDEGRMVHNPARPLFNTRKIEKPNLDVRLITGPPIMNRPRQSPCERVLWILASLEGWIDRNELLRRTHMKA